MNSRQASHFVSWTITPVFVSMLLVLACSHRQTTANAEQPAAAPAAAAPATTPAATPAKVGAVKQPGKTEGTHAAKKPAVTPAAKVAEKPAAKAPTKMTSAKTPPKSVVKSGTKPAVEMTLVATVATAKKTTMYVTTETLNVRSSPSPVAPVIGKLTRGSVFNVTVQGAWAKIADGQYVSVKYLSGSNPTATNAKRKLAAK